MGRLESADPSRSDHDHDHDQHEPPSSDPIPPPIRSTTNEQDPPDSPTPTSPSSADHRLDTTTTTSIHGDQTQPDDPNTVTVISIHNGAPQTSPPHHGKSESDEAVPFPPKAHQQPEPTSKDNRIVLYSAPPTNTNQHQANGQRDEITLELESTPAVPFPPRAKDQAVNQSVAAAPQVLPDRTVMHQEPEKGRPQVIIVPLVGNPWTSGLFDCCQHPRNAILTTVAPCVTFGQIAEILDNGSTSCLTGAMLYSCLFLVMCHWNVGVRYRTRMRAAFHLAETPVTDRIAHTLFPLCSLCQEFRELKDRGYDPFLGYQGVIAKIIHDQTHQPIINAPTEQVMNRL